MFDKLRLPEGFEIHFEPLDPDLRSAERGALELATERRLVETAFAEGVILTHRPDGAPVAEGLGREISVTHCKDWIAVAAYGNRRFGIDLEHLRTRALSTVAARFLSEREKLIYTTPFDWLIAWTMKEAIYKAVGIPGLGYAESIYLPRRRKSPAVAEVRTASVRRRFRLYFAREDTLALTVAIPID